MEQVLKKQHFDAGNVADLKIEDRPGPKDLSTAIPLLDRAFGGGLPSGSVIYLYADAESMGFVSKAVAVDKFEETVESYVKEISHASPLILKLNKRAVKRHIGTSFHQAVQLSSDYFLNTMMKTEDTLEGIKSFEEKRRPDWKNK